MIHEKLMFLAWGISDFLVGDTLNPLILSWSKSKT